MRNKWGEFVGFVLQWYVVGHYKWVNMYSVYTKLNILVWCVLRIYFELTDIVLRLDICIGI